MGLDIVAYSQLKKIDPTLFGGREKALDEGHGNAFYQCENFMAQAEGLDLDALYNQGEERMSFRAGGYSGYNQWRNQLAEVGGFSDAEDAWNHTEGPFWELINFSDCEGVIGPKASEKLYQDFVNFQDKAKAYSDPWFYSNYENFMAAFDLARNNGAVLFC